MDTHGLIGRLAADRSPPPWPMAQAWRAAALSATLIAACLFLGVVKFRPDLAEALGSLRFLGKFVVTGALTLGAFAVLRAQARPDAREATRWAWLLPAPALMAGAVALELAVLPPGDWAARLIGNNSLGCLGVIPFLGGGPLAVFLLTLRHGAPASPRAAGATAGLLAGGLAATFYAAHCPDDSPLFVAVWYTLAIAGLTGLGAVLGPRVAHW